MELWIRSQDKLTLMKSTYIYVAREEVCAYDENKCWSTIGVYNSQERALEVLDEIQDLIKPKIINTNYECECKNNPVDKLSFNLEMIPTKTEIIGLSTCVYEMPKE